MGGAVGYAYVHLRWATDAAAGWTHVAQGGLVSSLARHGIGVWGAFAGYFGLDSRDVCLILSHPQRQADTGAILQSVLPAGVAITVQAPLAATVRPLTPAPLDQEGLHVLRHFDVRTAQVDEFVQLSRQAWETFETSDRYRSAPRGLFRERIHEPGHVPAVTRLLLVTWYAGVGSWEESRRFPAAAADHVRRRAELTAGTTAIAARLLPSATPG